MPKAKCAKPGTVTYVNASDLLPGEWSRWFWPMFVTATGHVRGRVHMTLVTPDHFRRLCNEALLERGRTFTSMMQITKFLNRIESITEYVNMEG